MPEGWSMEEERSSEGSGSVDFADIVGKQKCRSQDWLLYNARPGQSCRLAFQELDLH